MSLDEERMIPTASVTPEGFGRYEIDEIPETVGAQEGIPESMPDGLLEQHAQELRIKVESVQPGFLRRNFGKFVVAGAGIAAVVGGALYLRDLWPSMPNVLPKADHEFSMGFGKIETTFVRDKSIDFGEVNSEFDFQQHTSLDKAGPFNCDTDIRKQKVKTKAFANILITEAGVTVFKDSADIKITGDISTQSFVNIDGGVPHVSPATGGVDVCTDEHEIRWAERFAFGYDEADHPEKHEDGILKNAGEIATACAVQKEGKAALDEAIKHNAALFNPALEKMDPSKINIEYSTDFDSFAKAQVDAVVAGYYTEFQKVADLYFGETDDHTNPVVNDRELTDCSKHTIEVKKI